MKVCNKCKIEKEESEFHVKRYKSGHVGLRSHCKPCNYLGRLEYRKNSPKDNDRNKTYNKIHAAKFRGMKLTKYWPGSTWQEATANWDALLLKQEGHCALCPRSQQLHTDHDHKTGRVRGLLCNKCNRGLGMFDDNASRLQKAIEYIKN